MSQTDKIYNAGVNAILWPRYGPTSAFSWASRPPTIRCRLVAQEDLDRAGAIVSAREYAIRWHAHFNQDFRNPDGIARGGGRITLAAMRDDPQHTLNIAAQVCGILEKAPVLG